MRILLPATAAAAALLAGCASARAAPPPLRTVPRVDLERYAGTWYEIAALPQRFQEGCTGTTATYSLRDDGKVDVLNRCAKDRLSGPEKSARGVAWPVDDTNAKLKVRFFWPFRGDYWIVELGPSYEYAVVGHPDRKYGWILSRTPRMDEQLYQAILGRLRDQGYDTTRFVRTLQPGVVQQPEGGGAPTASDAPR